MPQQLRHRRRRVLADLGRGGRSPGRAQRLGPGAGRRRRGRPAASRPRDDPAARAAGDHRAGRRPLVGRRPRAVRPAVARRTSWPRPSSWPRDGFPAWDGFVDAVERTAPLIASTIGPRRRVPRRLPAARPALAAGRARPPAGARGDARGASPPTGSTRSTTATSASARHAGWLPPAAPITRRRPARPHLDLGRADRDRLSRRPGHDPPAEQLRDRRPRAAGHPRPARAAAGPAAFGPDGVTDAGLDPPRDRGGQAGHGRSRRAPDRPGQPRRPGRAPARSGPRGRAGRADRPAPRRRPGRVPRTRRAAARSTSRSSTRDGNAVSLIESNYTGLRLGRRRPATRASTTRTGAATSASTRTTRTSSRRASGRSTRCSPGCCSVTARPAPWVVAGSMGGDAQPQIHAQLVSALVDGGRRRPDRGRGAALVRRAGRALRAAGRGPPRAAPRAGHRARRSRRSATR